MTKSRGIKRPPGEASDWLREQLTHDTDECITHVSKKGRWQLPMAGGNAAGKETAYVVMCDWAHGPKPEPHPIEGRYEVAHSCDNGHLGCVNPRHLRWDTRKGNHRDRIEHGTQTSGETHPVAKLSWEQVCAIRNDNRLHRVIAAEYGVSRSSITLIKNNSTWRLTR